MRPLLYQTGYFDRHPSDTACPSPSSRTSPHLARRPLCYDLCPSTFTALLSLIKRHLHLLPPPPNAHEQLDG